MATLYSFAAQRVKQNDVIKDVIRICHLCYQMLSKRPC